MVIGTDDKKAAMQTEIKSAFDKAKKNGSQLGASSEAITNQLAQDIADAIHAYATSLKITVNVPAIPVVGGATTPTSANG
jgi:hypothetical protein